MLNKLRYIINRKFNRSMDSRDIEKNELEKMVLKGAILIDVRSPQEYEEGHLEGALLIPEYELVSRCRQKLKNKEATYIVYCSSGTRSKKAQKELEKLGYTNVYNLYNGIQNYWGFGFYVLEYVCKIGNRYFEWRKYEK